MKKVDLHRRNRALSYFCITYRDIFLILLNIMRKVFNYYVIVDSCKCESKFEANFFPYIASFRLPPLKG